MTQLDLKKLLLGTSVLAGFAAMSIAAPAYAQTAGDEPIAVETVEEDQDDERDEVVVTGSRLKKSTFSSTSPLQVISTDSANQEGLFSPVEILQSNASASGQQIDSTFQGFVLDNGPGSETINLRALGASRTLVLLNGRRMAPVGVEGAPTQPSINLLPRTMIDNVDLLLDGASSVYGSDAVAGVINVVLRNDYDGLEFDISADRPEQGDGAGSDYTIGARYGINGDRGFIGGAVEYDYQDPWTTGDRDFLKGCETYREVTESGEIRTVDLTDQNLAQLIGLDAETSPCRPTRLTQRIFIPNNFGSIYYQPSINNTGFGFSESTLFGVPIDGDDDGFRDVNFFDFSPNGQQQDLQQLVNEQSGYSMFLNGEYTFEGDMNITPYFEALYAGRSIKATGQQPQLFPDVPADNPFNPCNFNAGGVDCNAAYNSVIADPDYAVAFSNFLNTDRNPFGTTNCFGIGNNPAVCNPATFGLFAQTGQTFEVTPIVGVRGDRNVVDVELATLRLVGGLKGDLPAINFGTFNDWEFDFSGSYSSSNGSSARSGIREDRLNLSLGIDPVSGAALSAPCAQNADGSISPILLQGCVPVNLFAPSLYTSAAGGDFATQAERDYLFDSRDFDTHYAQTLVDLIVQGDVFSLPGGEASVLLGYSYIKDELDSKPDDIARDGLLFGFFQDAGAAGSVSKSAIYGEAFVPLGTGALGLKELNLELAGRITDDEFYGTNSTYSVKAGWRPVDSLLLRATGGTSFRAPNLRELFLRSQSGFNTLLDPCATPDAAVSGTLGGQGTYTRSDDPRSDITLANCTAVGIDPTNFLVGSNGTSVEINQGGTLDLDPETSESFTVGFSFDQPWFDGFDFEFGATYFDLEIQNTIIETGAGFLLNQCYNVQPNQTSPFCGRIVRDGADDTLNIINAGFINRNQETARFVDYNYAFSKENINLFDRSWDIFSRAQVSNYIERESIDIIDDVRDINERVGEFSVPEWVGSVTGGFTQDRWTAAWTTRFIGSVESEEFDDNDGTTPSRAVEDFTNFLDTSAFQGAGTTVTCLGPDLGDTNCRPVFSADDYFVHTLSLTYRGDDWNALVGVSNIFNDEPPLVSPREVFSVSNVPLGSGYDLNGREFFIRLRKTFR